MEQGFLHVVRRILDATAFENIDTLRDFEALLDRSGRRDASGGRDAKTPAAQADSGTGDPDDISFS